MKVDSYTITARLLPGVLSSIPFFVLHFFYLRPVLGSFWGELLAVQITSDATILIAFLFLLIQISRHISKELFEKRLFAGGLRLPTTDYLLHMDSHFSREYTDRIHAKIKADFGIEIPSREQESKNHERSRKLINEAVSHVRAKVGAGTLVGQHNAEYGFVRNLAGGAVVALVVSLVDIAVFSSISNMRALWIS